VQQANDNTLLTTHQYTNDLNIAGTRYANDLNIAATRYAEDQQLALGANFQTYLDNTGTILQIGYGSGTNFPQYAALYLNTGYFRMVYSTTSGWGTSIVLLPALWSQVSCPKDYCQGAAITATSQSVGANLVLSIQGTIATLQVSTTVTLNPPAHNRFVARVAP
jgi:hypothetical protein